MYSFLCYFVMQIAAWNCCVFMFFVCNLSCS
jgi:hypothetical protein